MLANASAYPTFDDPNYTRELAATEPLTGPRRYLAFGSLARSLRVPVPSVGLDCAR